METSTIIILAVAAVAWFFVEFYGWMLRTSEEYHNDEDNMN